MASRDALPLSSRIDEALQKAARRGSGLTKVDREALPALAEAFGDGPVLRLSSLLGRLWNGVDRKTALNRFHQLKRRFNGAAAGVVLCSPSDNRDPEEKEVWFEADRSPVERVTSEVRALLEPEKASYSVEGFYPGLAGRMASTLLTFPAEVSDFGETEIPDTWRLFSENARNFLRYLSSRFMPMVQVLPTGCMACVRGFELLASGGRGEVYGELMREAKALDVSLEILDAVLLLVQTLTVQELRRRTRYLPRYSRVFFSLNLSPPLLADNFRLARAVIRRFDEDERSLLCFEMTEKFRLPEVRALAHLLAEFGDLKFAVDDVNDHHLLTVARLGKYASFTKLSHRYVQDVLRRLPDDPEAGLKALLQHGLPGKPHVLEGVEDFERVKTVFEEGLRAGRVPPGAQIYAQGFDCALDSEWQPFLQVPPGYGWQGQYSLPLADSPGLAAEQPPGERPVSRRDFLSAIEDTLRATGRQVVRKVHSPAGSGLLELTLDSRQVLWAAHGKAPARLPSLPRDARVVVSFAAQAPTRGARTAKRKSAASKLLELSEFVERELSQAAEAPAADGRLARRGLWRFAAARYYGVRGNLERQSTGPAVETLMAWADEPAAPVAYLLGGYGSGKTFAARMFCAQLRQKIARTGRGRPPLFVDLKDIPEVVARTGNLEDVLRSGAAPLGLDADGWRHLAQAIRCGQVLLVLDGFDEKAGHLAEKGALHRFRRVLHSAAGPSSKVLVASRHAVFADEASVLRETRAEELATAGREAGADARLVELLPLAPEESNAFLARSLAPAERKRVERLLARVHGLRDLATRPVVLRWLAERRHEFEQLLEKRGRLACGPIHEALVSEWLGRDEEKSVLVPELKLAVMEGLAAESWRAGTDTLQPLVLQRIVIAAVNAFYGGSPPADPARAGLADIRAAAFLAHDNAGLSRFAHASFAEYFLARYLSGRAGSGEEEALEGPPLGAGVRLFLDSIRA
ncbi:MAG: NACHT domain-containing protein [Candidatus Wallbacteria bacterium]|nr:NACHT domain-containing protein [Candidatus Wallbacteria bacterium]